MEIGEWIDHKFFLSFNVCGVHVCEWLGLVCFELYFWVLTLLSIFLMFVFLTFNLLCVILEKTDTNLHRLKILGKNLNNHLGETPSRTVDTQGRYDVTSSFCGARLHQVSKCSTWPTVRSRPQAWSICGPCKTYACIFRTKQEANDTNLPQVRSALALCMYFRTKLF